MKPLVFVAAQFFLLSLSFSLFFDPIGISYFLIGVVWILNRNLAYAEIIIEFLAKGQWSWLFFAPAITTFFPHLPSRYVPLVTDVVYVEILLAALFGASLAVGLSGKIVLKQIRKKAPDILGIIDR